MTLIIVSSFVLSYGIFRFFVKSRVNHQHHQVDDYPSHGVDL